ncbi:MAG: hypothetical protein OQK04_19240 [Kangiellaceae bacterium]|nr:hypothetical protein [Kangiellaceae bacterium]MCW9000854.1 hypothetical protein [Kangiellaceae bacterium]
MYDLIDGIKQQGSGEIARNALLRLMVFLTCFIIGLVVSRYFRDVPDLYQVTWNSIGALIGISLFVVADMLMDICKLYDDKIEQGVEKDANKSAH